MGTLLLLLFIFFIVVPVCRVAWRAWQLHRQWQRATSGMRDAFNQARNAAAGQGEAAVPRRKKKKIDPNVGEYVAFEEVTTTTTETRTDSSGTQTRRSVRVESQVEDAVWEDIK